MLKNKQHKLSQVFWLEACLIHALNHVTGSVYFFCNVPGKSTNIGVQAEIMEAIT